MFYPWHLPTLAAKPWRLLPQLDAFTDAECRACLHQLHSLRQLLLAAAMAVATVLGIVVVIGIPATAERLFGRNSPVLDADTHIGRLAGSVLACSVLLAVPLLSLTPYLLIMRRAIRRVLDRVRCPECKYSLLGLPLVADHVRCPECGGKIRLADHGLTPADIIAGARERPLQETPARFERTIFLVACTVLLLVLSAWILTGSQNVLSIGLLAGLVGAGYMAARHAQRPATLS